MNAVFFSGEQVSSKQFVDKVAQQIPGVLLITDTGDAKGEAQDETKAGGKNNFEGMLYASGPTSQEYDQSPNWRYCANIYKAQTGKVAPNVEAVIPDPQDKSKRLDTYGSISDVCQVLTLFQEIGDKAGPNLNDDTWLNAVNTYGPIRDPGSGQYAVLAHRQVRHERHVPARRVRLVDRSGRRLEGAHAPPEHFRLGNETRHARQAKGPPGEVASPRRRCSREVRNDPQWQQLPEGRPAIPTAWAGSAARISKVFPTGHRRDPT